MDDRRVMLITGSRKGIGRYLAESYLERGYSVVGCSRQKSELESPNYRHFCLDISNQDQVRGMFRQIRGTYGRLDVLINNAGIASSSYGLLLNKESIVNSFQTNVLGFIYVTQEATKLMHLRRFGRIVNISSVHVPLSTVGTSMYGATKKAVEQFSDVLAKEVSAYGVTINTVGLSYVRHSGMVEQVSEDIVKKIANQLPGAPQIEMEDVLYCVDFFVSDRANSLTRQVIYTSGA